MTAKLFTIDERVRWSAVDKAGIIFYGAYVRFFELAEMELFRTIGIPYSEVFDRFDIWLPRAHLESSFHYPSRLDDRLRVAAYFTRFGNTSLKINFDILHLGSGQLAVSGHEVLVCTTRDTLKPVPIPAELRALMEPYLMTVDDARAELGV
ncbi:MAG: thioesterase family protein [Gemmatimonadetes bacterium]|jgi:acyl-CoA thioester hydrolase|nr:thioesterase family protein [Gemmatimonadota bacterium]